MYIWSRMGWLRIVGSIKLYVSCAKEPCKIDNILQKRPVILSILLTEATPYVTICYMYWNIHMHFCMNIRYMHTWSQKDQGYPKGCCHILRRDVPRLDLRGMSPTHTHESRHYRLEDPPLKTHTCRILRRDVPFKWRGMLPTHLVVSYYCRLGGWSLKICTCCILRLDVLRFNLRGMLPTHMNMSCHYRPNDPPLKSHTHAPFFGTTYPHSIQGVCHPHIRTSHVTIDSRVCPLKHAHVPHSSARGTLIQVKGYITYTYECVMLL